ncbi:hypothetical protein MPK67_gp012 [Erwinia phage pEa_SNUABM_32]|uniref:Uncharacterized protein n=2 Tax=Alexandravirus TaxID=2733088 RepID=A0AAE7XJN1_9CAUD|nr:hypothetical protein MPK67_gp012 [Erwinia phage pEa_SNUABM_32]YP_010301125.1 hypothetical protein MPK68_gp012 [Erwinia phage pEa_SNUABM_3]QZE56548.1 hypothetical protein pEaSNUABM20_00012 [Erwinia phage pEa_SNUABM_20]QZE58228.1 hypothetical protein pEaSNUABM40_00012 [Erwinia phage pEa_SNUABM_40]UAW52794.1 hypothetical protein pEaSNUABM23_00012 [Erwinia phage pEa_SNUABM_23]UIW10690.1 hypothetical protein pEaSNUABM23_00012 [Erwinia phage pEa_SNUABM_31]QZE56209.1 hypothetical protein pEaSNUAB
MTEKITQLAKWFDAAKVAFKMGTVNPDGDAALLLAIHKRLIKEVEDAGDAETKAFAQTNLSEFISDLRIELRMFDLICRRFNTDLYPQIKIGDDVKIYIALMAQTPGSAVMAMTYLYLARCYTLQDMILNFLPNGFPASDALGLTWSIQKGNSDAFTGNLVDDIETVNSLYNKMYSSGEK